MDRLQRDMNRLFNQRSSSHLRVAPSYPAINTWANEDGLFVSAEMPGVSTQDIDISVTGNTLVITGERGADDIPEDARIHRKERGYGKFSRSIQLPFSVDAEKVEASFKNGVLNILLPQVEAEKPKKIAIKN
ncbi:MAG: Hsp20/alpha crystallin family protein [Anaerolineae bacterium]|nr:Hsp20/alpha crystallin family protein [Anaerolineae bacterium]